MENLINNVNFVSSYETRNMHTKSDNIEILMDNETDEIIESLLEKYQEELKESMKGRDFIFDSVDLLYYHLHKTILSR